MLWMNSLEHLNIAKHFVTTLKSIKWIHELIWITRESLQCRLVGLIIHLTLKQWFILTLATFPLRPFLILGWTSSTVVGIRSTSVSSAAASTSIDSSFPSSLSSGLPGLLSAALAPTLCTMSKRSSRSSLAATNMVWVRGVLVQNWGQRRTNVAGVPGLRAHLLRASRTRTHSTALNSEQFTALVAPHVDVWLLLAANLLRGTTERRGGNLTAGVISRTGKWQIWHWTTLGAVNMSTVYWRGSLSTFLTVDSHCLYFWPDSQHTVDIFNLRS